MSLLGVNPTPSPKGSIDVYSMGSKVGLESEAGSFAMLNDNVALFGVRDAVWRGIEQYTMGVKSTGITKFFNPVDPIREHRQIWVYSRRPVSFSEEAESRGWAGKFTESFRQMTETAVGINIVNGFDLSFQGVTAEPTRRRG